MGWLKSDGIEPQQHYRWKEVQGMSRQAWFRSHLGKFHGTLVYYSSDWRQSRRMGWGTMLVVSRSEELVGICGIECGEARAYQLWRLLFGKSGSWRIQRGEAYSRLSCCSYSLFRFFLVCLFLKCWSSIKERRVIIIIYQQLSLWKIIASHIFLIASCKLLYRFFRRHYWSTDEVASIFHFWTLQS